MIGAQHTRITLTLPALLLAVLAAFVCGLGGCIDVNDIPTPQNIQHINVDSLVLATQFVEAPDDSLFATIDGEDRVFSFLEVSAVRDATTGAWYMFVRASRSRLNDNENYEILYLQIDAVSDTALFRCNAYPVRVKQIDRSISPRFGLQYDRRAGSSFPVSYRTGNGGSSGEIHVLKFDTVEQKMIGTFHFVGYSSENDSTTEVTRGGFRLRMKR